MQGKLINRRVGLAVPVLATLVSLILLAAGAVSAGAFGIESFSVSLTDPSGQPMVQAGSHPDVATALHFNKATFPGGGTGPDGNPRDIEVNMPPGLIGNPLAAPTCTQEELRGPLSQGFAAECPTNSQVGLITIVTYFGGHPNAFTGPVFNIQPPTGVPAEFAFNVSSVLVFVNAKVRTGSDSGVSATISGLSQGLPLGDTTLTLWGVPADPVHDVRRGQCAQGFIPECSEPSTAPALPLMTNTTACAATPMTATARADSWQEPGVFDSASFDAGSLGNALTVDGCGILPFEPSVTVTPDTTAADTPAGLTVDVKMPQDGLLNPVGLAPAAVKNATVTLPAGVVINPGQATGLAACLPSQDGIGSDGPSSCPAASKVGTVAVTTPLLPDKLEGNVYVLQSNPPELKLLVAASADGVNLKLVGDVHLDENTGRLTTTFKNTPQLPFTDLKLAFSGGAQAALATPATCGEYESASDFTPWSAPQGLDALSTDSFQISSGPGGSACAASLPFTPSLIAGATTDQAGGYTNFSLLLQRGDGQQRVSSLQFKTPEGLLGKISTVPVCAEAQAAAGACPAASQIGHTVVAAGPGPYPLIVPQPGGPAAPIYLTGPYKGAPYGLEIAVPVVAGPFDLGTVVVRASIAVDRNTSQLTITTDPLPSILHGVPTDLRTINAVIDRPGFMFNPTSCASRSFSGTALSTEGAAAPISSHFQVGSCQSLKFKPNFSVSTSGRTSRGGGASLDAKIVYPTGAVGANQASQQANIAKVKVDLPKQLPSRLTTLQKACLAVTFEANPGNCPAASVVGTGRAVTPVLGAPLSGPAYFVSHGGEAFPSLVVVLQGAGVRVDLTGSTFISKQGITSSTFRQVPDVPITSFELILPQGPHSALAANGNLCTGKLAMPTAFVGQNGAEIHQSTKLKVTGCPKSKQRPSIKSKAGKHADKKK